MDLERIIGPEESRELGEACRRRQTALRPTTTEPGRFSGLLGGWEIDAIARYTPAPYDAARFRLISRGKSVPPRLYLDSAGVFREEAFRQLRAGGASLAIGDFEHYSNRTLALSRRFEAGLGCPVQANLYVTPAGGQGLGSHVDPHDVLVLQIAGRKTWSIYEGAAADAPFADSVLAPGGWLFLPKGVRHEVRNLGTETSVHLTLGFHPLTWGAVFEQALQRARITDPTLNAPLPLGSQFSDTREALLARAGRLLEFVNVPDHVARYYAGFPALGVTMPPDHEIAAERLASVRADTTLRWRDEAAWSGGGGAAGELNQAYRRAPLVVRAEWTPLVAAMREARRFTPADLPTDAAQAVLLSQFFADQGALAIE